MSRVSDLRKGDVPSPRVRLGRSDCEKVLTSNRNESFSCCNLVKSVSSVPSCLNRESARSSNSDVSCKSTVEDAGPFRRLGLISCAHIEPTKRGVKVVLLRPYRRSVSHVLIHWLACWHREYHHFFLFRECPATQAPPYHAPSAVGPALSASAEDHDARRPSNWSKRILGVAEFGNVTEENWPMRTQKVAAADMKRNVRLPPG